MDDRVFPGLIEKTERIMLACKGYLNIDSLESRRQNIVVCRALIMILLQEYTPLTLKKVGAVVGRDHTTVCHANRFYKPMFEGESEFYHFIYLNVKAIIDYKPYFEVKDVFEKAARKFPIPKDELKEGLIMLRSEPIGQKSRNKAIRGLIVYLLKNSVSQTEMVYFLNLHKNTTTAGVEIPRKKEYLNIVSEQIQNKIKILTANQKKK